jgi:hypothetical protein
VTSFNSIIAVAAVVLDGVGAADRVAVVIGGLCESFHNIVKSFANSTVFALELSADYTPQVPPNPMVT